MIVQCEECKTNFNLDEKRLRGDSAKVRCSKCKHVFMIQKNQEEPAAPEMTGLFGETSPAFADEQLASSTSMFEESSPFDPITDTETVATEAIQEEPFASTFDSIGFSSSPPPAREEPAEEVPIVADEMSFSDMAFAEEPPAPEEFAAEEPPAASIPRPAFDEDMLSFADVAPTDEDIPSKSPARESFDFDFSSKEDEATATPATASPAFDFDFSAADDQGPQSAPAENLDLGGIDFGAPTPEPAKEAPTAFTFQTDEPSAPTFVPVPSADDSGEESAFSVYRPFVVAGVCATAIITLLTTGYFYFKGAPGNLERMGIQNIGSSAEAEKGSFTITSPKAAFIKNKVAGELFVVSGDAVNGYTNPRTGVEVQVSLFSKSGEELGTKTAFCGSAIDKEQLTTLPLAKIEEELTKAPSEDPLENTPVEAGKSVPCLVVFKDVPKQATDYGIEIIHSSGEKLDDF